MSEVLASLKKIGGNGEQYTETSLWTNPNPSANFDTQTVTLSDNIGNYKYIAFKYKYGTATSDTDYMTEIFPTSDVIRSTGGTSTTHDLIALGIMNASNQSYVRMVYYVSETSLQFTLCYRANAQASTQNGANPLEILGINELAHGVQDISTMHPDILETFTGSSSSSTKTIAVTQKPRFIMYVQGRTTQNTAIFMMFDCENETAWNYGMYNGGYRNQTVTFSNYISSISDTSVSITNFGSSATMNQIFIYY